uniref:Uncharacterized protein n=1 Tax=Leersia perrieri TaxID=77586 RepID=A0A0D9W6S0_9ORYZ
MDFAIGHHSPLIEACAAFLGFVDQRGGASVRGEVAERHTIILMQPSQNRATRTFMDFNSVNHALDGLYDQSLHAFLPYDRRWIKHKMFQHLKWLAQQ